MMEAKEKILGKEMREEQKKSKRSLTFTDGAIHIPLPRTGTNTEVTCLYYTRFVLCIQFTSKIN